WETYWEMETVAIFNCMPFLRSLPPRSVGLGSRHKAHEHAVKLLHIEIELDFDALNGRMLFIVSSPGQSVAIAGAAGEIYGHKAALGACDDAGIDPRGCGQFVPHNVGSGGQHCELCDVSGNRRPGSVDFLDRRSRQVRF